MNLVDLLALCTFAALGLCVIAAAFWVDATVWHRCPDCRRWHSRLGIMNRGRVPAPGSLTGEARKCEVCR